MRKTSAALATLSLAVLTLTGCTSTPSFDGAACDRAAASSGIDELATVTGEVGETPRVEVFTPVRADKTSYSDLIVGTGPALTSASQGAVIEFALYSGESGEQIFSSAFEEDAERLASIDYWSMRLPGLAKSLECATGGSRVLATFTAEDFGAQNIAAFELEEDETVIAVIDVVEAFPAHAEGSLQFNDAGGMPTVVRAPDGRPGIIVPDSDAPTELETQTLIKGDGEKVEADSTVLVHYTGVTWADRTVFDSSWGSTPATFELSGLIEGFGKGLEGQTVGSQVLIVIPPELGYGDQQQGTIPADSTLVFVVDILALDPPAAVQ